MSALANGQQQQQGQYFVSNNKMDVHSSDNNKVNNNDSIQEANNKHHILENNNGDDHNKNGDSNLSADTTKTSHLNLELSQDTVKQCKVAFWRDEDHHKPDESLPERVGALFMLDDNFFRSSFIRHKLPSYLFSNGARGMEPLFGRNSPAFVSDDGDGASSDDVMRRGNARLYDRRDDASSLDSAAGGNRYSSMVRNVPIRVLGADANADIKQEHSSNSADAKDYAPTHSEPTTVRARYTPADENLVPILNNGGTSQAATARKYSASPRVTFFSSSDVEDDDEKEVDNAKSNHATAAITSTAATMTPAASGGRKSPSYQPTRLTTASVQSPERNSTVSYRSIPIIKKYSTPQQQLKSRSEQQQHQQQQQQRSVGQPNAGKRPDDSWRRNGTVAVPLPPTSNNVGTGASTTVAGLASIYGGSRHSPASSSTPTSTARLIRSVNTTPTPLHNESMSSATALPPISYRGKLRAGVSTPSLIQAALTNFNSKADNDATSSTQSNDSLQISRRSESPTKRSMYPSFLRRTQTAHTISPAELPQTQQTSRSIDTVHYSMPSAAALSAAMNGAAANVSDGHQARHSLHETSTKETPGDSSVKSTGSSSSLTSLTTTQPVTTSKQAARGTLRSTMVSAAGKSPSLASLRLGQVSASPGGKTVSINGRNVAGGNGTLSGGTASAKVRLKKASFMPCIRAQNDVSDEEDRQIAAVVEPARGRSLSQSRIDDSVEEAIRSLESFDPNDYLKGASAAAPDKQPASSDVAASTHIKSPTLCAAALVPTRSFDSKTNNQRVSTTSSSSYSSNSADAPASLSSGGCAATDTTLSSSSDIEPSSPQPPPLVQASRLQSRSVPPPSVDTRGNDQRAHQQTQALSAALSVRNLARPTSLLTAAAGDVVTASSSGSATPTFSRSFDNAGGRTPLATTPTASSIKLSIAAEENANAQSTNHRMGNNTSYSGGAVVTQAFGALPTDADAANRSPHLNNYKRSIYHRNTNASFPPPAFLNKSEESTHLPPDYVTDDEDERLRRYDNVIGLARQSPANFCASPYRGNDISVRTSDAPFAGERHANANAVDESAAATDAEAHLRKRFLCTQLTDCAKVIEINAHKMQQFTMAAPHYSSSEAASAAATSGWRQPHILRHNLAAIRDTMYTIEFAFNELIDALTCVCIDAHDSKYDEFQRLCAPLATSQSMIRRLRANLDATGWTLTALTRVGNSSHGNDALDQFITILKQLPKDCYKLVQWVYQLGVWNAESGAAVFLTASNSSCPTIPPPPAPMSAQRAAPPIETEFYGAFRPDSYQQQRQRQRQKPSVNAPTTAPARFGSGTSQQQQERQQPQQYAYRQQYRGDGPNWSAESGSYVKSRSTTPSRLLFEKNNNSNNEHSEYLRKMATTPTAPLEQQQNKSSNSNLSNNNKLRTKSPNTVRFNFDNEPSQSAILLNNKKDNNNENVQKQQQQHTTMRDTTTKTNDNNNSKTNNVMYGSMGGTPATDTMDGGESTTSSSTAADDEQRATSAAMSPCSAPPKSALRVASSANSMDSDGAATPLSPLLYENDALGTITPHSTVYEEDDLLSVGGESIDSLYGDYATADSLKTTRSGHQNNTQQQQKLLQQQQQHLTVAKSVGDEERELLRFHEPQVIAHTGELCHLIEEFFNIVEERQNAKAFVQKIQMICIKAQTLVCISRVVARDDACLTSPSRRLHSFLDTTADRLDALLNECIANARVAREKTESVPAVQAMVSSVVGVSQTALGLKQFWMSCV